MVTANKLIEKALRLINVPGQGSQISPDDQLDAFEALQLIINSKAVSSFFQPGPRTHFFALTPNKSIYTYGPGKELDTNLFDDPAPITIEDAYVREGSAITSNEQVDQPLFNQATPWTAATGWVVANNLATLSPGNGSPTLTQALSLVAGVEYTLLIKAAVRASGVVATVTQGGTPIVTQSITGSGDYTVDFTFGGGASAIVFTGDNTGDLDLSEASILIKGADKVAMADGVGSDYGVTIMGQKRYNRRFTKGTGGRPYQIYYEREAGSGVLRFDNSGIAGDILVMDVRVNVAEIPTVTSTLRINPEHELWLSYAVADHVAPGHGKSLTPRQLQNMAAAYNMLAAGNNRINPLEVDHALRPRPVFDINRGDP